MFKHSTALKISELNIFLFFPVKDFLWYTEVNNFMKEPLTAWTLEVCVNK